MGKSALVVGLTALLVFSVINSVAPFIVPCVTWLVGLIAGVLAVVFDRPRVGNGAGALSALGVWASDAIGGVLMRLWDKLGWLDWMGSWYPASVGYRWDKLMESVCLYGMCAVVVMAILGAVGGWSVWWLQSRWGSR